jgi:Ca2+/Na+ antiporter
MSGGKYKIGEKIFSVVFLIWFVLSIAALIATAKLQALGWTAIVFGQYFVVFGVAGLINEIKAGFRHPIIVIFPMIGFTVVISGLLWQFGNEIVKENVVKHIPNMIAAVFLLVGILLLVQVIIEKSEQKKCTFAVQGKCVEVKWHYSTSKNGGSPKNYCPVYEYYYNGQTYTGSQEIYTNLLYVNEGEYREIFLNPEKPTVFYEKGMSRTFNIMSLILGVIFVAVGAVVIYAYNFM